MASAVQLTAVHPATSVPASRSTQSLIAWTVLCAGGGGLIGALTSAAGDPWFQALQKPSFNPPAWLFAPVWTTLYLAMGVAAWQVSRVRGRASRRALTVFLLQLAVNFAWSPIFFAAHAVGAALVIIVVLWLLVALTIALFARVSRPAAWLLAPYAAWVTFAAVLNGAFLRLN